MTQRDGSGGRRAQRPGSHRIVTGVVAVVWGLAAFWIGIVVAFPGAAAAERASWEVQERTGGKVLLQLAHVRPWHVVGLAARDVVVLQDSRTDRQREAGSGSAPSPLIALDGLKARVALLPMLRGTWTSVVDAVVYDGHLRGRVGWSGSAATVDLTGKGIDLSRVDTTSEQFSAKLAGELEARVDLTYDTETVKNTQGTLKLEADRLQLTDLTVSGFSLGEVLFEEALLAFDVKEGVAEVREGLLRGEQVEAEVDGTVTLNATFSRSRLSLKVHVKLPEDLDKLAQLAPDMKNARDEDGTYHFSLTGTIERPRFRPDRVSARARSTPMLPRPVRPGGSDDDAPSTNDVAPPPDDQKVDAEEMERRREERLERLRQRREEARARREQAEVDGETGPTGDQDGRPDGDVPIADLPERPRNPEYDGVGPDGEPWEPGDDRVPGPDGFPDVPSPAGGPEDFDPPEPY